MYYRCVIGSDPRCEGIVAVGTGEWTSNKLTKDQDEEIGRIIKWFNHYLIAPSKWMKNRRVEKQVMWWFKEGALDHLKKAEELRLFLNRLGHRTTWLRAESLDCVYEDKFQAAVTTVGRRDWEIGRPNVTLEGI